MQADNKQIEPATNQSSRFRGHRAREADWRQFPDFLAVTAKAENVMRKQTLAHLGGIFGGTSKNDLLHPAIESTRYALNVLPARSGELLVTETGRASLRLFNPTYPSISEPFNIPGVVIFKRG